ncbi:MAG: hypothetical protein NTZ33_01620 [Bacteroidetes bacterium]|nr:hypothetical protein [Bacteroidota bacterium]
MEYIFKKKNFNNQYKYTNNTFKIFVFSIFLILILPKIFMDGLFMDGLIYSSIGNNLAIHLGTFFSPRFSSTLFSSFHEHPPLVFGIESLFFKLFGNAFYIEKIYSGITALLTALIIILIWKKTTKYPELYWLPILFWITIERVFWSFNNNMLENTLGLFSITSIYVLILSIKNVGLKKNIYIFIASFLLFLSFLSKGFTGLFPLGFYFLYFIANYRYYSIKKVIFNTFLLIILFLSVILIFFLIFPQAYESISKYIETQVVSSIAGKNRVGSRFSFICGFFEELILILLICTFFILINIKRIKIFMSDLKENKTHLIFFLFIGLSAFIPLMVSPKLSLFYMVPSFPYFAIFFSILIGDIINNYINHLNKYSLSIKLFRVFIYLIIVSTIIFTVLNFGKPYRDKDLITDINIIGNYLPEHMVISVPPAYNQQFTMFAYFQRKHHININCSNEYDEFVLLKKDEPDINGYKNCYLNLINFKLLKKQSIIPHK